jgi:hypothetical protein
MGARPSSVALAVKSLSRERGLHIRPGQAQGAAMRRDRTVWLGPMLVLWGSLYGCNKAEPPGAVQDQVTQAQRTAAQDEARARAQQAKIDASANASVQAAAQKADQQTATAAYDVALTHAEGDYQVALVKCESLAAAAQKSCKEQARADLEAAKARAEAERARRS